MTCERCGCTDNRACVDASGEPCCWIKPRLCSACATDAELAIFRVTLDPYGDELEEAGELATAPATPAPLLYDAYDRPVR